MRTAYIYSGVIVPNYTYQLWTEELANFWIGLHGANGMVHMTLSEARAELQRWPQPAI